MEFAAGIPGTIGGAVVMNAGAYGGEMRDIIETVTVLDETGAQHVLSVEELELGYRTSCILKKHYIVTQAVLKLTAGEEQAILGTDEGACHAARRKAAARISECRKHI